MTWDADVAWVGSLLSEPTRCRILFALADGRALPATTLASEAHVAPSSASAHLTRLVDAGWLGVERHGRHRYYRLERNDVGEVLEALARIAPEAPVRSLSGDIRRRRLRRARTCYRHLAGRLGTGLLTSMVERGWIVGHDGTFRPDVDQLSSTGHDVVYQVTPAGTDGLARLGIEAAAGAGARHCVDWTEQRHHLSGQLGAALADRLFDLGWLQRTEQGRVVDITESGAVKLHETFGIDPTDDD
jgi:DNA-binding transcriptional ArsR family regulator